MRAAAHPPKPPRYLIESSLFRSSMYVCMRALNRPTLARKNNKKILNTTTTKTFKQNGPHLFDVSHVNPKEFINAPKSTRTTGNCKLPASLGPIPRKLLARWF